MPATVAIVGRPNVGKSSLLNMLAHRRVSIVDPTPGVTRDRVTAMVTLPPAEPGARSRRIALVDTGGHGIEDAADLTVQVERQITLALSEADLVLLVVDAQVGITPLDEAVARLLRMSRDPGTAGDHRRQPAPVLLVANKVDGQSHEPAAAEASRLGFGPPVMVSATSGYNKNNLIAAIHTHLPPPEAPPPPESRRAGTPEGPPEVGGDAVTEHAAKSHEVLLAIVGKRNAGKSTLVNTLAGQERVIVSEVPGTTRDAIDVRFEVDGRSLIAIDTAGVRKRKSIDGDIEYYSHHRALRSIRRADVVMFIIDAAVPISQVDQQLGQEILKHHKPTVLVINKWDLAEKDYTAEQYAKYLEKMMRGFQFAPIALVSAAKGDGLHELITTALDLHGQAGSRIGTGQLNRLIAQIIEEHAPRSRSGRQPKIYYASQLTIRPPTIGLWVNDPDMFDPAYQRFLINRLRDDAPFPEVPIKLTIHGKDRLPEDAEG